ncbi:uncharacterized protein LY79DRAFT_695759 [Colletotrichum navitas]|uniref:Uncharacterized protein n=1 Tax=Colletotrichum navitas TaxID=681940 RepID=A0AAD8PQ97_9PEZI|nr:uncharacterized protein LY79DRAFT_695759 [Colletotrichum navitas]KAK1574276.1 hypothetical protein LY79DRAFT_695759 [Colletotrichum navitas]
MPNLESVKLSMDDDEKRFPDIRVRHRTELAQAIRALSLPALTKVDFDFFLRRQRNERAQPPVLHNTGVPDPLSSAVFELSLNLVNLKVEGVFDESLLRPIEHLSTTSWPNMKFLDINLCITTPSGGWYFAKRDDIPFQPLYTHQSQIKTTHSNLVMNRSFNFRKEAGYACLDPVHVFRSKADDAELTPFVDAYADALLMMPKLKSAALTIQLEDHIEGEPGWFCIAYFAPCKSAHDHPPRLICPRCNRGVTRQLVTLLLGWEPNEKLADKLQRTGAELCTEPMVEKSMAEFMSYHDVEDDANRAI